MQSTEYLQMLQQQPQKSVIDGVVISRCASDDARENYKTKTPSQSRDDRRDDSRDDISANFESKASTPSQSQRINGGAGPKIMTMTDGHDDAEKERPSAAVHVICLPALAQEVGVNPTQTQTETQTQSQNGNMHLSDGGTQTPTYSEAPDSDMDAHISAQTQTPTYSASSASDMDKNAYARAPASHNGQDSPHTHAHAHAHARTASPHTPTRASEAHDSTVNVREAPLSPSSLIMSIHSPLSGGESCSEPNSPILSPRGGFSAEDLTSRDVPEDEFWA